MRRSLVLRSGWTASCLLSLFALSQAAKTDIDLYLNNAELDPDAERAAQNIVYYGVYYVGTPETRFLGCFDTGSADLWLPSSQCTSSICRSHDQYNASASSTSRSSDSSAIIQYGTGTVAIQQYYDTVRFGEISVTNQQFGAATALTRDFSLISCDGLVGLGFPAISSTRGDPPFFTAVSEDLLDSNEFGLWLSPTPGVEPAGQLTLGGMDSSKFSGGLQNITVSTQTYWQLPLTDTTVGSNSVSLSPKTAVIDSGTTAIVASSADVQKIHEQIPGASYWEEEGVWNVSCNIRNLPNITFGLGNGQFSVPPSLYVQALIDIYGNDLGACASSIVDGGDSDALNKYLVLGTNFLRAWYTVYSVNGYSAQIGLAPAVGSKSSSASALTASGGRKLLINPREEARLGQIEDEPQLFRRTVASFDQPKWGRTGPHSMIKETKDNTS